MTECNSTSSFSKNDNPISIAKTIKRKFSNLKVNRKTTKGVVSHENKKSSKISTAATKSLKSNDLNVNKVQNSLVIRKKNQSCKHKKKKVLPSQSSCNEVSEPSDLDVLVIDEGATLDGSGNSNSKNNLSNVEFLEQIVSSSNESEDDVPTSKMSLKSGFQATKPKGKLGTTKRKVNRTEANHPTPTDKDSIKETTGKHPLSSVMQKMDSSEDEPFFDDQPSFVECLGLNRMNECQKWAHNQSCKNHCDPSLNQVPCSSNQSSIYAEQSMLLLAKAQDEMAEMKRRLKARLPHLNCGKRNTFGNPSKNFAGSSPETQSLFETRDNLNHSLVKEFFRGVMNDILAQGFALEKRSNQQLVEFRDQLLKWSSEAAQCKAMWILSGSAYEKIDSKLLKSATGIIEGYRRKTENILFNERDKKSNNTDDSILKNTVVKEIEQLPLIEFLNKFHGISEKAAQNKVDSSDDMSISSDEIVDGTPYSPSDPFISGDSSRPYSPSDGVQFFNDIDINNDVMAISSPQVTSNTYDKDTSGQGQCQNRSFEFNTSVQKMQKPNSAPDTSTPKCDTRMRAPIVKPEPTAPLEKITLERSDSIVELPTESFFVNLPPLPHSSTVFNNPMTISDQLSSTASNNFRNFNNPTNCFNNNSGCSTTISSSYQNPSQSLPTFMAKQQTPMFRANNSMPRPTGPTMLNRYGNTNSPLLSLPQDNNGLYSNVPIWVGNTINSRRPEFPPHEFIQNQSFQVDYYGRRYFY